MYVDEFDFVMCMWRSLTLISVCRGVTRLCGVECDFAVCMWRSDCRLYVEGCVTLPSVCGGVCDFAVCMWSGV